MYKKNTNILLTGATGSATGGAAGGDDCLVNLDALTGRYPPLLVQDGGFIFPTSETNGTRYLSFGKSSLA